MRTRTQPQKKTDAGADAPTLRKPEPANDAAKANPREQPRAEAKTREEEQPFFEHLASLGNRWSNGSVKLYIYRLWPELDLGEKHYICIVREPIDEDYLLKHFGSGKYMLLLKDSPGKPRTHNVSIHNPEHPPRVDEALVLSNPINDRYFKTWGTKPSGNAVRPETEPTKDHDIVEVIRAAREGNKLDPQVISWLQDVANHRDDLAVKLAEASAKNPTGDLAAVITALKGILPPQAHPEKSDMLAIIAAIKDMQPKPQDPLAVLQQAKNLFAPAGESEGGSDEIERLDRVLGFAQKLAALRLGAGDRNGWDIGLDYARELAPPLMQFLNNLMVLRRGAAAPGAFAAAHVAVPAAPSFDPYRDAARMREYARAMNAQPAAPPSPPAGPGSSVPPNPVTQATPPNGEQTQIMLMLANYGSLIVSALNAGTDGVEFAENVSRLFGTSLHAMIAKEGEDTLVHSMLAFQEIALFGEPRVRKFAHEFVHFQEILDTEQDQEDTESAKTVA